MAAAASVVVRAFRFTRALRFRIAVSYVIFFAVLLAVLGVVFRKSLEVTFESQTTALLEDDWDAVKGYLRLGTPSGNEWFFDAFDPEEAFIVNRLRRIYMLADSEGHVLQWSPIIKASDSTNPLISSPSWPRKRKPSAFATTANIFRI